jgi:NAD(P)-dependent dehydrogenase (short-subunit alcohol dehydrogenase family)
MNAGRHLYKFIRLNNTFKFNSMSKAIIVTGANGNLGTAVVKKLLDMDYRVIAVDQSGNRLEFASGSPLFDLQSVDLGNETAVGEFIQLMIRSYKKIDGALLLAGGFAAGDIHSTGGDDLKKMYSLNFETAYFISRNLFPHMVQNGYGRLVFMGARPALIAEQGKNTVAYALSKSLLFKLADMLNASAAGQNVVASVVAPSTIDTELNRRSMPDADFSSWVKADQIASVLEFICSEKGLALREPVYKIYNNA